MGPVKLKRQGLTTPGYKLPPFQGLKPSLINHASLEAPDGAIVCSQVS